ncbi:MAG TPA: DUF3124 domain-containing protein [Anaerolineae bacterium]|nr:DUF3124 domain-containing protein [Anaerolineae bacterium]
MKLYHWSGPILALIVIFLFGCSSQESRQLSVPPPSDDVILIQDLDITTGQTIYVPAYSEIYYARDRTLELAITLSIRNTDSNHAIVLTSVRYYDTEGQLITEYLPQPKRLGAMASTDFFVGARDQSNGLGANFMVEWVAEQPVYEPVIEAIMISASGAQGISFTSPGRVVKQLE